MTERTWTIAFDLREDASSIFVPMSSMPDAVVGDRVEIDSSSPPSHHHGHVSELVHDDTLGEYCIVTID